MIEEVFQDSDQKRQQLIENFISNGSIIHLQREQQPLDLYQHSANSGAILPSDLVTLATGWYQTFDVSLSCEGEGIYIEQVLKHFNHPRLHKF